MVDFVFLDGRKSGGAVIARPHLGGRGRFFALYRDE